MLLGPWIADGSPKIAQGMMAAIKGIWEGRKTHKREGN